jgi:hypothetical protein
MAVALKSGLEISPLDQIGCTELWHLYAPLSQNRRGRFQLSRGFIAQFLLLALAFQNDRPRQCEDRSKFSCLSTKIVDMFSKPVVNSRVEWWTSELRMIRILKSWRSVSCNQRKLTTR